jgi:hypothetical protein
LTMQTKIIYTGRRIILKVSQYIYESLNIPLLWERCNSPHRSLYRDTINSPTFDPQNMWGRITMPKMHKESKICLNYYTFDSPKAEQSTKTGKIYSKNLQFFQKVLNFVRAIKNCSI